MARTTSSFRRGPATLRVPRTLQSSINNFTTRLNLTQSSHPVQKLPSLYESTKRMLVGDCLDFKLHSAITTIYPIKITITIRI